MYIDLENLNRATLKFIWNNTDTFRELKDKILHVLFVRVHIKQYWNRETVPNKTHFLSEFLENSTEISMELLSNNTTRFFQSSYHTILFCGVSVKKCYTFSGFISSNVEVTTKYYCKIFLFVKFYHPKLTFLESSCQITDTFFTEDVPDNTPFSLIYELILNLYWLG